MSRSDNDRLGDIIGSGRRIDAIVACGRSRYEEDWTLRAAAAHEIEHVVDATIHLGESTLKRLGDVPVAEMRGMRALIAHVYWKIDYSAVWKTMSRDVPNIVDAASRIFDPSTAESDPYSEDYSILPRGEPADGDASRDSGGG